MKVGMYGMGKLGLPVALAIESRGHEVMGYDIRPEPYEYIENRQYPFIEEGASELLENTKIRMTRDIGTLALSNDIVFMPIQTPHQSHLEGDKPLPDERADFSYAYLKKALVDMSRYDTTLTTISTCLPGTYQKELKQLKGNTDYIYSPLYIAMGTVINDYLNPEYSLIGTEDKNSPATKKLQEFYSTIHDAPQVVTDITTAEGIKVFYNTNISQKIILANAHMQVAHKMGMNIDDINQAMAMATDRIVSPKYMRSGGPDSGGCHPRDLIALSWLGEQIDLKPNWFEMMAQARDKQTEWTADLIVEEQQRTNLPIYIMGKAFKPETNITTGSGATLVAEFLKQKGVEAIQYDPHIDEVPPDFEKGIYFIATEHKEFSEFDFPEGSTVLSLWRTIPDSDKIRLINIGNLQR